MAYARRYDPEIDLQSATGCLNDAALAGRVSYALTLSSNPSVRDVDLGGA
jgi:hypothetical protein